MVGILFCLYEAIKLLACSRPAGETSSVLVDWLISNRVVTKYSRGRLPRVGDVCGMANTPPVGLQVILRAGQVARTRKRGRHGHNKSVSKTNKERENDAGGLGGKRQRRMGDSTFAGDG